MNFPQLLSRKGKIFIDKQNYLFLLGNRVLCFGQKRSCSPSNACLIFKFLHFYFVIRENTPSVFSPICNKNIGKCFILNRFSYF